MRSTQSGSPSGSKLRQGRRREAGREGGKEGRKERRKEGERYKGEKKIEMHLQLWYTRKGEKQYMVISKFKPI